jgi:hypothetical protein
MPLYGDRGGGFELCPEGEGVPGILLSVSETKKDDKRKLSWKFEIQEPVRRDGEPFFVWKNTYAGGPYVKEMVQKMLGEAEPLTDEAWASLDLESLVGDLYLLDIIHNESNGKTYANVDGVHNPADLFDE